MNLETIERVASIVSCLALTVLWLCASALLVKMLLN